MIELLIEWFPYFGWLAYGVWIVKIRDERDRLREELRGMN